MIKKITDKFSSLDLNIYIIAGTLLVNAIMYFSWYPVLAIYLRELGAADISIGYVYGLMFLVFTVFQFIGGIFADRFSLKKIIIITTVLVVPAYILAAISKNWVIFIVFILLSEIFNAIQWPAFMLIISESVEEKVLGFAYSVFEFAILAGFTIGPALGFLLIDKVNVRQLILFSSIICVFTAFIRWIYLKESPNKKQEKYDLSAVKEVLNKKLALTFVIFTLLGMIGTLTLYGPFIAMYCKDIFKFDESKIQLMIFFGNLFASIFSFAAGYLIDKYGSRFMLGLGLFFQAVFFLFWLKSGAVAAIYILFIISALFLQTASIAKNKFMIEIAPAKYKGLFVGMLFTVSGAISSVAPVAGSYAKQLYGLPAPFYLNFIIGCLAVFSIILYKLQKNK